MTAPKYKEAQGIVLADLHKQIVRLRRWVLLTAVLATVGTLAGALGVVRASQAAQRAQALVKVHRALSVRTSIEARDTRYALCTFRNDLEVRLTTGREFLRSHPHGIPGIPAATLRSSIENQARTVRALSGLNC